jgi:glutaredoxin
MLSVQLLVSDWCPTCPQAERIWREVAEEKDIRFEVLDVAQAEGRELIGELRIRTIPSVVIDGKLKGVGVQTRQQALALVADAPARARSAFRFVGMTMGPTSRANIAAAMLFLVLSGAFLPFGGLTGGATRPVSLHLFLLGFVTFMIYGVGEHMLPRFAGRRILMGPLAWAQHALAHAGLIGLLAGLWAGIPALAVSGGALACLGLLVFAIRLMPVVWGEEEIPAEHETAAN